MSKLFFLCILFPLLSFQTLAARTHFNSREFAGTYFIGNPSYAACIHLDAKGNFRTYDAKGSGYISPKGNCNYRNAGTGTYVFSRGVLKFTLLKFIRSQHSLVLKGALKSTFIMYPVRWSGRLYLLEEEASLADFTNAINLGLEPRRALITDLYYGQFFLRKGDELKKAFGNPSLPGVWNSFLLEKAVEAKITKVESEESGVMLTIDRGSEAGLKTGMRLIRENAAEPSLTFDPLVVSVEKGSARLKAHGEEWKAGDKLKTSFTATQLQ